MLEDSQTPLLIAHSRFSERLGPRNSNATIFIDIEGGDGSSPETEQEHGEPQPGTTSQSLLYAIYTSGSTGKPERGAVSAGGFIEPIAMDVGKISV